MCVCECTHVHLTRSYETKNCSQIMTDFFPSIPTRRDPLYTVSVFLSAIEFNHWTWKKEREREGEMGGGERGRQAGECGKISEYV